MNINFFKYHGTGNDFIIIDNRNGIFKPDDQEDTIQSLCQRKFNIGADGLMLLENSEHGDFEMKYFNSDGKESTMCGNGGRCMVAFAETLGIIREKITFLAIDGMHEAILEKNLINLKMQNVSKITNNETFYTLNTGSPHYVAFYENIDDIDIDKEGRRIRNSKQFIQEGINVNFVKLLSENHIYVRTYERGVETETMSCGTGAVASSIVTAFHNQSNNNHFFIETLGGNLEVTFKTAKNNHYDDVWLKGPTTFVFKGEIDIIS